MTNKENKNKQNKSFLTLKKASKQPNFWHSKDKRVYHYSINNKWTLVENGKVLIDSVDWVRWHSKGVYSYIINATWILVKGCSDVYWYDTRKAYYAPQTKKKWKMVEDGDVLVKDIDCVG